MVKVLALFAALLILGGCDMQSRRSVETQVRQALKDPDSAKFDSEMQIAGGGLVACGKVNAKNPMGGYTGSTDFMVWGDEVLLAEHDRSDSAIPNCCALVLDAVREHIASAEIPNFKACDGLIKPFTW